MKIAIAGSSGLIGSALVTHLRNEGHEVLRLVRRDATAPTEVTWNPTAGTADTSALVGIDAFINLAGAGVGDHRWTDAYKKTILDSRVTTTRTIANLAIELGVPTIINASAIGWYGDAGDTAVDESTPCGSGFLADVVRQWEAATLPAEQAGVRVVLARTGLVAARSGGAWAKILPIFKLGIGGRLGSGKQYWSFITLHDELAAFSFLLSHSDIRGPVNLTAPQPATNAQMTRALGKALHRPTLFAVPSIALKIVLGEFSQEVLGSARVEPQVLMNAGFTFAHPDIASAMRTLV